MSRTIRRLRDKKKNTSGPNHYEEDYTYDRDSEGLRTFRNPCAWLALPKVKLEGKAFKKAYWDFHRDRKAAYGFDYMTVWRFDAEVTCRAKNKQEIIKYYQNNEYEVMLHKPECLSWYW